MHYLYKHLKLFILAFVFFLFFSNVTLAENSLPSDSVSTEEKLKLSDVWWGKDKLQHFLLSGVIAGFSYKIYHDAFDEDKNSSVKFSFCLTLSLGFGKEVYDGARPDKNFCIKDLLFDILGIGTGLFIATR